MASKWLDFWAYADWTDVTNRPLFTILDEEAAVCAERQAFTEVEHDSSFNADNTWPITSGDLYGNIDSSPNTRTRILNAIYPENCVKTDEVNSSGTDTTLPSVLTLANLLQDIFSYSSGIPLSNTEKLAKMTHVKQWFQVLDYPEFYWRPFLTETGGADYAWITDLQIQYLRVEVFYTYNVSAGTFLSATAHVTDPATAQTDIYSTNDLNESAPWSNTQDVRDYAIGLMNDLITNDEWTANQNNLAGLAFGTLKPHSAYVSIDETAGRGVLGAGPDDEVVIECDLYIARFRFKLADHKRATSPNTYTAPVQFNYHYEQGTGSNNGDYDDFSTGAVEGNVHLDTITPDVSDWHYIEIDSPDFDNSAVLTDPVARGEHYFRVLGLYKQPLSVGGKGGTTNTNGYYVKPNQSDGTAWEWYTP